MALADAFDGAPLLIPSGGPAYGSQRLSLDGRVYTLGMAWNESAGGWFFSLLDSEDAPIITGIRVISNWPLLRWRKFDPRCPPGELVAIDETSDGSPPRFADFGLGRRVQLVYFAVQT